VNAARRPGGSAGGGRGGRRGEFSKRYPPRRKVCTFCVDKISYIDYKDIPRLRRHLSERGKIEPRRKTGTCAKHQRALAVALKRARHVALMPFTAEHIRRSGMVLRSPDDRRRDDRGPRRDMPPRVAQPEGAQPADGAAPPEAVSADGAPAPAGVASEGVAAPPADGMAVTPASAPIGTNGAAPVAPVEARATEARQSDVATAEAPEAASAAPSADAPRSDAPRSDDVAAPTPARAGAAEATATE